VKPFFGALLLAAALLQTAVWADVLSNVREPLNLPVNVPCANGGHGDTITLTGNLHVIAKVTTSGKATHMSTQFQPQGVSGISAATGVKYQGTGVTRQDLNVSTPSFPASVTTVNNFRIIGQGPNNNLLVHENTYFTINANGTVTAVVDNFRMDCK